MLLLVFIIYLVSLSVDATTTLFDGTWQLDPHRDIGSCKEVMRLIGESSIRSSIICSLTVTETMSLSVKSLHLVRVTRYSRTEQTFQWNIEEVVDDLLLGNTKQTLTMLDDRHMKTVSRRTENGLYVGLRKIDPKNNNLVIYTMNYTAPGGRRASVVRYFTRMYGI